MIKKDVLRDDRALLDAYRRGDKPALTRVYRAYAQDVFAFLKRGFVFNSGDDQYVFDALSSGALGYILKNIRPEELITSIKAVNNGNFFVSQSVGFKLVRQARQGLQHAEGRQMEYHGEINFLHSCFESLSNRETEILHLLLQDLDNHEIAERLFIAEQTVRNYISSIYAKIGVSDRIHAKKLVKSKLSNNPAG